LTQNLVLDWLCGFLSYPSLDKKPHGI